MGPKLELGVSLNSKGLKSGIANATGEVKNFGQTIQTAMGFSLYNVISRITGLMQAIGSGAIKIAARFEMINLQFESLIGNTKMAKKLMAELREFSVKTPFTPEDVFKAGKILLTQFPARQVQGELKMLGEIAAVTGKDLNELALIYAKVAERGKVNARVLNQFANAGIPISRFLAEVKGSTAIRELSEQGRISFNDMREAIKLMANEWKGLERASQTVEGRWSTLVGAVKETLAQIGEGLKSETLDAINTVIDALKVAQPILDYMVGSVKLLALAFNVAGTAVGMLASYMDTIFEPLEKIGFANPFAGMQEAAREQALLTEKRFKQFFGFAKERGIELTGSGDFMSPMDRASSEAIKMQSFAGDAAAGLFRGRFDLDIPQLQLDEARKQTVILEEINAKVGDRQFKGGAFGGGGSAGGGALGGIKEGVGR